MNKKELGIKIKEIRKKKGLTQKELGAKVDLSERNISRIENGEDRNNEKSLKAICGHLDIPYPKDGIQTIYKISSIDNLIKDLENSNNYKVIVNAEDLNEVSLEIYEEINKLLIDRKLNKISNVTFKVKFKKNIEYFKKENFSIFYYLIDDSEFYFDDFNCLLRGFGTTKEEYEENSELEFLVEKNLIQMHYKGFLKRIPFKTLLLYVSPEINKEYIQLEELIHNPSIIGYLDNITSVSKLVNLLFTTNEYNIITEEWKKIRSSLTEDSKNIKRMMTEEDFITVALELGRLNTDSRVIQNSEKSKEIIYLKDIAKSLMKNKDFKERYFRSNDYKKFLIKDRHWEYKKELFSIDEIEYIQGRLQNK